MPRAFRLSRRTLLKGAGALMGLPFLEAMLPARARAATAVPKRFVAIFLPNGMIMNQWTPSAAGANFPLSPIMQPLANSTVSGQAQSFQNQLTVITNLANAQSDLSTGVDLGHEAAVGSFLTAVPVQAPGIAGVSVDQVVALAFGSQTQIPSLQLGNSTAGYDTFPFHTHISWSDANTPLPKVTNPLTLFNQIFPNPTGNQQAAATLARRQKSILDFVQADAAALQKRLGAADSARLDQYLTNVRAVEQQLQSTVTNSCTPSNPPANQDAPDGDNPGPSTLRTPFTQLMFDMIALAFQCDATRVVSFQFSIGVDDLPYDFLGISSTGHHTLTHGTDSSSIAQTQSIDTWEMEMFAYLCRKLDSLQDADGTSILHNSIVYASSENGDGAQHDKHHLPVLLAGSAGGVLKTGQHLVYPDVHDDPFSDSAPFNTPRAQLYVSLLNALGLPNATFGGDGTGPLPADQNGATLM